MLKKTIFFIFLSMLLLSTHSLDASNIVVPGPYGYSLVHPSHWFYSPARVNHWSWHPYYHRPWYGVVPTTYGWANYGYLAATRVDLNVRSEPRVPSERRANVRSTLRAGEQVYILGQSGSWYYVQSAYAPLRRGYVYGKYLYSVNPVWHYSYVF